MTTSNTGDSSTSIFSNSFLFESKMSQEIKIIAEIEKIWILYDGDQNGDLDLSEFKRYLYDNAFPKLSLSEEELESMFEQLDEDGNRMISKSEMKMFLLALVHN